MWVLNGYKLTAKTDDFPWGNKSLLHTRFDIWLLNKSNLSVHKSTYTWVHRRKLLQRVLFATVLYRRYHAAHTLQIKFHAQITRSHNNKKRRPPRNTPERTHINEKKKKKWANLQAAANSHSNGNNKGCWPPCNDWSNVQTSALQEILPVHNLFSVR